MAKTPSKRRPKAEANTYGLPRGDDIRREIRSVFASQRNQVLSFLRDVKSIRLRRKDDQDIAGGRLPEAWPTFRLGGLKMSERFVPLISAYWDEAGKRFRSRVDLDPDVWDVTTPGLQGKIETATLEFCEATNKTTSLQLDEALKRTREELIAGVVTRGESVDKLTKRVNNVFDNAEKWRARRIAQTEASRAVHAAQEQAAADSGIVAGWEWLLSSDACPKCLEVAEKARRVKLGTPFAKTGDGTYGTIKFPPLHPHCNCTCLEVLTPEYGGPKDVEWSQPVTPEPTQPTPTPTPVPAPTPTPKPPRAPKPAGPDLKALPIDEALKAWKEGDRRVKAIQKLGAKREAAKRAVDKATTACDRAIKRLVDSIGTDKEADYREQERAANRKWAEAKARLDALPHPREGLAAILKPKNPSSFDPTFQSNLQIDQARIAQAQEFLSKITEGQTNFRVIYEKTADGRAYCVSPRGGNAVPRVGLAVRNGPDVVIHEIGHALENTNPGWADRAHEFRAYRVAGEKPRKLQRLFPGYGYKAAEVGCQDDFGKVFGKGTIEAYYVGKDYGRYGTEITSMGLQELYNDPVRLATKDPEWCKFLLGMLSGDLRK